MNGTDIGQIVAATIISAGGIGGIIIAAIRFSSNIIAERLSKRYELKLNKTIENYKTHLEKGTIFHVQCSTKSLNTINFYPGNTLLHSTVLIYIMESSTQN